MIIEQSRNFLTLGVIIAVMVIANTVYKPNRPICPSDFKDPNERFDSFFEWEKEFRQNNPNAEISELAKARKDFYIEHNCKEVWNQPKYDGIDENDISQRLLNIIENYNL